MTHYRLTWPQIGILAVALGAAFLGGVGAGAAIVGGNLPGEITFALVGLVGAVIAALGGIVKIGYDRLTRALADNTAVTHQTLVAAEGAADSTNWRQAASAWQIRAELAERKVSLIAGVPQCGPCRAEIDCILEGGRVLRRASDPPAYTGQTTKLPESPAGMIVRPPNPDTPSDHDDPTGFDAGRTL